MGVVNEVFAEVSRIPAGSKEEAKGTEPFASREFFLLTAWLRAILFK